MTLEPNGFLYLLKEASSPCTKFSKLLSFRSGGKSPLVIADRFFDSRRRIVEPFLSSDWIWSKSLVYRVDSFSRVLFELKIFIINKVFAAEKSE